jgi:hypothetical protein
MPSGQAVLTKRYETAHMSRNDLIRVAQFVGRVGLQKRLPLEDCIVDRMDRIEFLTVWYFILRTNSK